ncbi:MAG TPA: RNA-binding protein [Candidatus Subteraquimicrobiales bacterium]
MSDKRKLYVGNLSFEVTEGDLNELFAEVGTVETAQIITDRNTGKSKGFAFVEMSTDEEAKKAIDKFNGYSLKEREIVVNEAKPRRATRGFGGGQRRF